MIKKEFLPLLSATNGEHLVHGLLWGLYPQSIPLHKKVEFKQRYLEQWQHNLKLISQLKEIEPPKDSVILKGIPLMQRCYPEHGGARQCSDIDVWIETVEKEKSLEGNLQLHGYECIARGTWWGEKHKTVWRKFHEGSEIVFEIHRGKLFYHLPEMTVETLAWENGWNTLRDEYNLVYLIGHLAFQHNFSKLIWPIDVAYFIKTAQDLDWELVRYLANKMQLVQSHRMTFWLLEHMFDLEDRPWEKYFSNRTSRVWHNMLNTEFLILGKQKPWQYFAIKHLAKDDVLTSLLYDIRWPLAQIKSRFKESLKSSE